MNSHKKQVKTQALLEYFLVLLLLALLTVIGKTNLIPTVKTAGEAFSTKGINTIIGQGG
ncbi:MAG: hypothetical protein ABH858_02515 [Candidatus Omnitrophota bacterium]